ncbi:MAG TPA: hypothetical protein VLJ86_24615 [Ramlibacter sp.]|nr:hypothetical protein [Ramlibacter sp.]
MERLRALCAHLLASGNYAPPVTYPAVPLNRFCIRVVVNRLHTDEQMLDLVGAIAQFDRAHPRPLAQTLAALHGVPAAASATCSTTRLWRGWHAPCTGSAERAKLCHARSGSFHPHPAAGPDGTARAPSPLERRRQ